MTTTHKLFIAGALLASALSVNAASHAGAPMSAPMPAASKAVSVPANDMADGEIRKVDKENKKITIKHGVIKNLDMPGMTMVFQVKDPALMDKVKTGDKIRFSAEQSGSALVVTDIQTAK